MNRRRLSLALALAAVLVGAALCWLAPLSRTSQAAPAPSGDAAFKGKVLLVNPTNMTMGAFVLERAKVQKIGDHSYLVGKGAGDGRMGGWIKGRTVRLQMEHIVSIIEFEDLNEMRKAMQSGGAAPIGIGGYGGYGSATTAPASALPLPAVPPPPASAPRRE